MANTTVDDIRPTEGTSALDATARAVRTMLVDAAGGAVDSDAVADGADVALGATADAAVVTPSSSGTVVGLLKGLLSTLLNGLSLAAGSALIGKVGIDQTTPGTTDSVSLKSQAYGDVVLIHRAGNVTPYSIFDTVGTAIDLGVMGPANGRVLLQDIFLEPRIATVPSGMGNFRVIFHTATPPSAIADNGAWTDPLADTPVHLGGEDVGTPIDHGAKLGINRNNIGRIFTLGPTGHLWIYLITDAAYTPATNSEIYAITVHTVAL